MKPNVNGPVYVIVFAGVVSALFTAAIVSLHAATAATVRQSEELFEQRALLDAFGLDGGRRLDDEQTEQLYRRHIARMPQRLVDPESGAAFNDPSGDRAKCYLARSADGKVLGYALPIWGVGFWARIDGYLAVSPDLREVLGIVFLRHQETPGLGGRITERAFRDQFRPRTDRQGRRRRVSLAEPDDGKFIHVGGRQATGPEDARWDHRVDAVTGASGTSAALERFLNENIAQFRRAATAAGLGKE